MKPKDSSAGLARVATVEIENTGVFRDVLRFKDPKGRVVRVAVPSALMGKAGELGGILANLGWQTTDQAAAVQDVKTLGSKRPKTNGVMLITNGWWSKPGQTFRCGSRVISSEKGKIFYVPTETGREEPGAKPTPKVKFVRFETPTALTTRLNVAGTVESWREEVSKRALKSSRIMTAICASFAAPLLRLLEIRPFGVVIFGETRDGKTTAEIAAASVIGIGTEQGLPKWAMTDAARQELCRLLNDLSVPLDDIALIQDTPKAKYQTVQDLAYLFSIGGQVQISTRGMRAMGELPQRTEGYRSIIVTSNEKSMRELAAEVGKTRMGGEASRLIDIPASRPGSAGVWDRLTDDESSGNLDALGVKLSDELKSACRDNHGAVMIRFLEKLIADTKEAVSAARKAMRIFKKLAGSASHSKQVQGIVDAFATVYAGGSLAIRYKNVSWSWDELRDAVLTCCRDAVAVLDQESTSALDPHLALVSLVDDESLIPTVADAKTFLPSTAIGRKRDKGNEFVIEILSGNLKMHDVGVPNDRLLEYLDKQNILRRDAERNAAHNVRWPGLPSKVRAHRLVWPSRTAFEEWKNAVTPDHTEPRASAAA